MTKSAFASVSPAHNKQADLSYFTTEDGVRIAYKVDGSADRPALVLSNSIGTTLDMWDEQIPELTKHFRVVRYDFRGHGTSGVPVGDYADARLGRDVLELMDLLKIERAHLLGLSMGGYVAQWLGVYAPERFDRIILSNTAARFEGRQQAIAWVLGAPYMTGIAEAFLSNWFPRPMLEANGPVVQEFREMLLTTPQQGLASCLAALRDTDLRKVIGLIKNPTLVIAGEFDTVTSVEHGKEIAALIPGSKLEILPAVHLTNVEFPDQFLHLVLTFLGAKAA